MEYRPQQKAKFGSIEAGKAIEDTRERIAIARRAGAGRQRRRQGEPISVGYAERDVPLRGAPHSRDCRQSGRCGPRDALGICMGTWTVRDLGRDRRRAHGEGAGARREAVAAAGRESAGFAGKIFLPNRKGTHELFRFGFERALKSLEEPRRNLNPEVAERSHAGGAGKFRREPDRPWRWRGVLRIPRQNERHRRRYCRDAPGGRRAAGNGIRSHGDRQPGAEFLRGREPDAVC